MNSLTQVKSISMILKHYKNKSGLTVEDIISKLPYEFQMSRTAFNAYLHGTVQTPPTREFFLSILNTFNIPSHELDYVLRGCGFAGNDKNLAKQLVLQCAKDEHLSMDTIMLEVLAGMVDKYAREMIALHKKIRTNQGEQIQFPKF